MRHKEAQLKKEMYIDFLDYEVMITRMRISDLGIRSPGSDPLICKSTDITTRHIRSSVHAFTMTSLFGITCIRCGPLAE